MPKTIGRRQTLGCGGELLPEARETVRRLGPLGIALTIIPATTRRL